MIERRSVYDALSRHPEAQRRYRESEEFREAIDAMAVAVQMGSDECETDDEYAEFLSYLKAIAQEWA